MSQILTNDSKLAGPVSTGADPEKQLTLVYGLWSTESMVQSWYRLSTSLIPSGNPGLREIARSCRARC